MRSGNTISVTKHICLLCYINIVFVDRQLGPGGTRLPRHLGPG